MRAFRHVWLPLLLLLFFSGTMALLLKPMPVDETRYLSVAWEMHQSGSYILPQLNGAPYAQKPPLLFWLINLDWRVLGVNAWSLRLIPLLFGMACVLLVYRLGRELWRREERIATLAALIFGSTTICMAWSGLIMFDMLLTLWVLVGMLGLACAAHGARWKGWLLLATAVAGGILTKGPVILLHLLPTALLVALWKDREERVGWGRWSVGLLVAAVVGVAIALAWAIPAATKGGDAYREAIFVNQSVQRAVSSFSHRAPFWYYLQWIPGLLWPWIVVPPAWCGWRGVRSEEGGRMALVWVLSSLILFSCISGKRIYYLLPLVGPCALLLARNMARFAADNRSLRWQRPVGYVYAALGAAGCVAACLPTVRDAVRGGGVAAGVAGIALLLLGGAMVVVRGWTTDAVSRLVAISSAAAGLAVLPAASVFVNARYNVSEMAHAVGMQQAAGRHVACYGKYHGQFGFTGRLEGQIEVLESWQELFDYARNHPDDLLVAYTSPSETYRPDEVVFQHPYRGKQALLLRNGGILRYIAQLPRNEWPGNEWERMQKGEIACLKAYR